VSGHVELVVFHASKYLDDSYMIHKYSSESQSKGKIQGNRRRRGMEEANEIHMPERAHGMSRLSKIH